MSDLARFDRDPEFETLCEIGRGGMGSVELVRMAGPGEFTRLFVLKRLRPDRSDEETVLRFVSEGRIAGAIRHANVVQTHHVGQDRQGMFLLLEYVEGASLEQLLTALAERGRRVPLSVTLRVALDALSGLAAVHEAKDLQGRPLGVLHRDVTLQNLLVGVDGVTRIADFGIAKSALSAIVTDQQYLVGKLRYMAPEYVRRERVSQAMDIYSLGISLWHMLTGRTLWRDHSEAELVERIQFDNIPPVSTFVRVPEAVEAIAVKACARTPAERFASAREMAHALEVSGAEIASHGEVAALIRECMAGHLDERRKLVAEVSARPRPAAPERVPDTSRGHAREARLSKRSPPRRARLLAGAAALLAAILVLTSLAVRNRAPAAEVANAVTQRSEPATVIAAAAAPALQVKEQQPALEPRSASAPDKTQPAMRATRARPPSSIVVKNPYRN
jgi:serine/threonine-protein kinase